MALASFGEPSYLADFRNVVRIGTNGQYTIQPLNLEEQFGPARSRGGPIEQRHYDIARSLQVVLAETVLHITDWLYEATRRDCLCRAGGVALHWLHKSPGRQEG